MTPVALADSVYLHFGTSSVSTGAATNADSTPTVVVAEDGVDLAYVPTVTNVAVGLYKVQIDATGANGFEAGRRYSVYAVAAVGGVTGRDGIGEFEVLAVDLNAALDVAVSTRLATAGYTAPLDAAGTRTAVGLAAANLDTQLAAVQADTDNIQTRIPVALVGGRIDASVGAMAADAITAAATAADFGTEIGTAVWATATRALTDKTGFGVSSLAADTITAASIAAAAITSSEAPALANLDAAVSSRLATAGYTATDNTSITAIKTQTDKLTFTVPNKLDVNILSVNGIGIAGSGTALAPWGPA